MQTWEEDSEEGEARDLVWEDVTECVRPLQLCHHHRREGMMSSWRQLICHQDCNWTCFDCQTYGHSQCRNILIKLAFGVCPRTASHFTGLYISPGPRVDQWEAPGPRVDQWEAPASRLIKLEIMHGNSRNAFLRLDNIIYFCCPGSHQATRGLHIHIIWMTRAQYGEFHLQTRICKMYSYLSADRTLAQTAADRSCHLHK